MLRTRKDITDKLDSQVKHVETKLRKEIDNLQQLIQQVAQGMNGDDYNYNDESKDLITPRKENAINISTQELPNESQQYQEQDNSLKITPRLAVDKKNST